VIDCQLAGLSGDMILGALIDLGADVDRVTEAIKRAKQHLDHVENVEVYVREVMQRDFRAKKVEIVVEEEVHHRSGMEMIDAVKSCAEHLEISDRAKKFAVDSIETLINAEAHIHGGRMKDVHMHEAGSFDTVADIIGAAVALEDLKPVAVGGGLFRFSHGAVPSPAPAPIEILKAKNFPMVGGPVRSELATPTGVAVLVNMVDEVTPFYPMMKPIAVGYGAGTKEFKEIPNVLRMVLGKPLEHGLLRDSVYVLETNVDDVTGEVLGHAVERLLHKGARDISIIPMSTKKNRPGHIVKVITDREHVEELSLLLMEETGTIGVRLYPCERKILARERVPVEIEVNGVTETVNVKVSTDRFGRVIQVKPEYDDVSRLAQKTRRPLRSLIDQALAVARQKLKAE